MLAVDVGHGSVNVFGRLQPSGLGIERNQIWQAVYRHRLATTQTQTRLQQLGGALATIGGVLVGVPFPLPWIGPLVGAVLVGVGVVIAAVNGHAYGGGLELALCCDFIYASSSARFALPEVTLGIMPGMGGTQNLPRAIGDRRAKELIMTGQAFTAQQALDWGMVNQVIEPEQLLGLALRTAQTLARNAPLSVRQVKKSIRYGGQMELRTAFRFEIEAYNQLVDSEDRREGVLAFNEKRPPRFKGR